MDKDLTPTSYALLGLLAIQPWSTYELANQMDRTLSRFWPRAKSKLYEEPKKLLARGLATATDEAVGKRARTVYAITPEGRRALSDWLARPGGGPVLEFEQLLKVFFSDNGTTEDLRRTLRDTRDWVQERTLVNIEVGQSYLEGHGPYPQRAAVNTLVGRFLDDFLETLDRWAGWAEEETAGWPDSPAGARVNRDALAATVQQGRDRSARWAWDHLDRESPRSAD